MVFATHWSSSGLRGTPLPGEAALRCSPLNLQCSWGPVETYFAELALSTSSVPPGHAFVTVAVPEGEGLNWCVAVKVGSTVVGAVPLATFTRDELLAECLASCAILGLAALVPTVMSVMSQRTGLLGRSLLI